ncbi:unnamed protein product [Lepeophtheirus salmonis]|uniref:(salmon louse) hypothetical protein n=1 Tax=Lepeophtheirus salmonis TaxID=72036 RepID=A0A7R8CZ02_LEPSM|nr:unnamed protein product [Lepeophtheirus salmonis]CAF2945711.1 unnamed protein product [Lepeophtheirus salmonis]
MKSSPMRISCISERKWNVSCCGNPLFDHLRKSFKKHGPNGRTYIDRRKNGTIFWKALLQVIYKGNTDKIWCLCSKGGYLYAFDLYMGKSSNTESSNYSKFGVVGNVILSLIGQAKIPRNEDYKIFYDNFFIRASSLLILSQIKDIMVLVHEEIRGLMDVQ